MCRAPHLFFWRLAISLKRHSDRLGKLLLNKIVQDWLIVTNCFLSWTFRLKIASCVFYIFPLLFTLNSLQCALVHIHTQLTLFRVLLTVDRFLLTGFCTYMRSAWLCSDKADESHAFTKLNHRELSMLSTGTCRSCGSLLGFSQIRLHLLTHSIQGAFVATAILPFSRLIWNNCFCSQLIKPFVCLMLPSVAQTKMHQWCIAPYAKLANACTLNVRTEQWAPSKRIGRLMPPLIVWFSKSFGCGRISA